MTTSEQPTVLRIAELAALRVFALGGGSQVPSAMRDALAAKGMLDPGNALTPAGQHAIDVGSGRPVPGIDN